MPVIKAMSSSVKTPGFYLKMNLLAAAQAAGISGVRALLIAHSIGGDIVADSEVRTVYSADEVATALGNGSPGHLAAIQAFAKYGALALDIVAPTAPTGVEATLTLEFSAGTPTATHTWEVDIAGRTVEFEWYVGEAMATVRTRAIAAINSIRPRPVVASAGTDPDQIDIDALGAGTWGNDIVVRVTRKNGTEVSISGAGNLASGTGEFDITTALGRVTATEYFAIGLVTSNADYVIATSSSNVARLRNHIDQYNDGLGALVQYGFAAYTGTVANAKAGAVARNSEWMSHTFLRSGRSLPGEVVGADLADSVASYLIRPNYNRIGNTFPNLVGAADVAAGKLTPAELEDLQNNGVSPIDFIPRSTDLQLVNAITSHSLDSAANPDFRAFYQSDSFGVMAVSDDIRTFLPQQYPHTTISPNLPEGADSLPAGVVEIRDVESSVFARLRQWAMPLGVVNSASLESSIANSEVVVEIDSIDESQVNIFIPLKILKPLAKFSGVVHKVG